MFNIEKTDDKIEVTKQSQLLIFAFIFFLLEIFLIIAIVVSMAQYGSISAEGIATIIVAQLTIIIVGIYLYIDGSTRLIIDNKGITKITKIKSQFMPWSDIKDFGVSYSGAYRRIKFYCLYFSKDILNVKNKHAKKLRGKMIKFIIEGTKERETILKILPFCTERAIVSPFIGE